MNDLQKYLSTCLLATAALLGGASPAFAVDASSQGTKPAVAVRAALENVAWAWARVLNPAKLPCNQGVGNGPEDCDPGSSNNSAGSNDEVSGARGTPGRKGGNK